MQLLDLYSFYLHMYIYFPYYHIHAKPILACLSKYIYQSICHFVGYLLVLKLLCFALCRSTPLQVIHVLGNFMRIWSVYSLYSYLSNSGDSIVGFIFSCLVPSSIIFLVLQKPWRGRPLPNSQVPLYLLFLEITSPAIRCALSYIHSFRLFLQLSMEESWHSTLYYGVKDFLLVVH